MEKGLDRYSDMKDLARQRSTLYSLLALVFRQETTARLIQEIRTPEMLEALLALEVRFDDDFLSTPISELIEELTTEYARLFLGPGKHISPHESVHHEREDGEWGGLWGASTVEVKKFIEATGLEYVRDYSGMPDHISVELEFMAELIQTEVNFWAEGHENKARQCLLLEKRFLAEHLANWMSTFCEKIISEAESSFYIEMAALTKRFIQLDQQELLIDSRE